MYCFIIEADGIPIGECWLQEMNLTQVLEKFPNLDVGGIDLVIFKKAYWGQGTSTEVIQQRTEFGFSEENIEVPFWAGVNQRKIQGD